MTDQSNGEANEAPPITIQKNTPTMDQLASAMRSVALVIGVLGTLSGLVAKHNIADIVNLIQSNNFITALGIVVSAVAFIWGQWKTRHRGVQLVNIAGNPKVPDSVAKTE